jgi:hypothetical protein
MWWLRHGLAGWTVLSLIWGVATIAYDAAIEAIAGTQSTISWQAQQASIANPVIPTALGLVVGGLTIHFFKVRAWGWFQEGQPWHDYAAGFLAGAALVALSWTQRG